MMYRALLTDVGNVIAPFFLDRFTRHLSELVELPAAEVDRRLYQEMSGAFSVGSQGCQGIHRGILTGEVKPDDYFAEVQRRLGSNLRPTLFWYAFREVFEPNRRLVGLWERLRREGKVGRIVLVTDADPVRLEWALRMTGFKPDAVVASFDVGRLKPDESMFRQALHLAGAGPQDCLFVDDLTENVQAARELGIESVQYLYPRVELDAATDILINEFRHLGLVD